MMFLTTFSSWYYITILIYILIILIWWWFSQPCRYNIKMVMVSTTWSSLYYDGDGFDNLVVMIMMVLRLTTWSSLHYDCAWYLFRAFRRYSRINGLISDRICFSSSAYNKSNSHGMKRRGIKFYNTISS